MAISSAGIGSGLDVNSIVSQLKAIELAPLRVLQTKAANIQTRISAVGQIKSQISALSDAAFKLTLDSSWDSTTVASSNITAVTGTITGIAAATSFSVSVSQLAKAQSTSSTAVAANANLGTGTLTIDLGTWDFGTDLVPTIPPVFGAPTKTVTVSVGSGEDTLAAIAKKINDASAGVTATVLKDASGERLLVRSKTTGEPSGFRITVADDDTVNTDNAGLSRLAFDPGTGNFGLAANSYQKAQNTLAKVNGIDVTSTTTSLENAVSGLTLNFGAVTTSAVEIAVTPDRGGITKNIQDFVAAYNAINKTLTEATKYDDTSKTAGILQGDTVAVGLKNALISVLGSSSVGSTLTRLSEVGIDLQIGGALTVSGSKLSTALADIDSVKKLFKTNNENSATNGIALKVKDFSRALLSTDGLVTNKTTALEKEVSRNSLEQAKINSRADAVEKRLKKQYASLDVQIANLNSLNGFVTQQVAQWNKRTG
jgi:flagellar hook-associated protein 2